jgi:hypothetical protein
MPHRIHRPERRAHFIKITRRRAPTRATEAVETHFVCLTLPAVERGRLDNLNCDDVTGEQGETIAQD